MPSVVDVRWRVAEPSSCAALPSVSTARCRPLSRLRGSPRTFRRGVRSPLNPRCPAFMCEPSASPPARPAAAAPAARAGLSPSARPRQRCRTASLVPHALDVLRDVLRRLAELLARPADALGHGRDVDVRKARNRDSPPARVALQHERAGDSHRGRADGYGRSAHLARGGLALALLLLEQSDGLGSGAAEAKLVRSGAVAARADVRRREDAQPRALSSGRQRAHPELGITVRRRSLRPGRRPSPRRCWWRCRPG